MLKCAREAVKLIKEYISEGISFNQETTLTGRSIIKNIINAKDNGFYVVMNYIGGESPKIAKERVKIRVSRGGHGISDEDIERAIRDAQSYASEDNKRKEYIDILNDAESLVYKVEQGLNQSKESIDRAKKSEIKSDLRVLKKLVKKAKPEKITDIQVGEIRQAKDKLEMAARDII